MQRTDGKVGREMKQRPYADAPRLPGAPDATVDVRTLVVGAWRELEIGPGRGAFLFERAAAEQSVGLVGIEVRRKWAMLVDARLATAGLGPRARVFAADARLVLPRIRPNGAFKRVFLHFPDPWWKKRHQKRLIMRDSFLAEI